MFRKENLRLLIFECVGLMLLSIGGITTAFKLPIPEHTANSPMLHDIYISLSLYMCILLFGRLSGANFNPAVSIGLYLNSHCQKMKLTTLGTMFFVMFILILTTEQTTFIQEESWVHLFIPICLYGGRKYLTFYLDCQNMWAA